MRPKWKAARATILLATSLAALLAFSPSPAAARSPQGPPDPPSDQFGGRGGDGRGDGPMGMRRFMGDDGRMGPDGDRGARGEREEGWGRGGRMGPDGPMGMPGGMGRHGMGEGPRGFGLARVLNDPEVRQQIGVSADQAAKIRQQESDFRKAQIRNRAELEIKRMDLHDLLSAEKPDRSAIDAKLQEISAAQLTVEKAEVGHHLDMRDALTPA